MRIICLLVALCGAAWAQDDVADPYATPERPPFNKHDHIQIVVVERTKALASTDLRTDRRSRWELDLDNWIKLNGKGGGLPNLDSSPLSGNPGIDMDARYRQDNSGRTSRAFDLTFTVTAEVVDIKPNGNLVIEARKRRQVNGETETIRLTGVVSPSNVNAKNTVSSSDIANLDIEYDGRGTAGSQSSQGVLGWLLSQLWPF